MNAFRREITFMLSERTVMVLAMIVFCFSSLTLWFGHSAVKNQHASIDRLYVADQEDRLAIVPKLKNWGYSAYYNFHLTYDRPSDFAFVAMGQRDLLPWKHRLRMLALEGQIYERDVANPIFILMGRLDFAFLATFVLPLVLIILLHDIRSSERIAGRYNLLVATAGQGFSLWFVRVSLRSFIIFISLIIPLLIASFFIGVAFKTVLLASVYVFIYTFFWMLLCYWFSSWRLSGSVILVCLIAIWLLLAIIIPAGGRYAIEKTITIPSDADILLHQRETVNDAWDLPKESTMNAFVSRHPELSDHAIVEETFEWKWYYAFQQVGDQETESLSHAYRTGRIKRDYFADLVALLVPPALLERALQKLAETDMLAALAYEDRVRDFHAELRSFYYPKLFPDQPFDKTALDDLPVFNEKTE